MKILGLSCFYHDSAAALIVDGRPVAAVQEERFSRKKNDPSFPIRSIEYCLKTQSIDLSNLDAVVFYEKPLQKLDRQLDTFLRESPMKPLSFVNSFVIATQKTLFLRKTLTQELKKIDRNFSEERLLFSEHHLSHAASAYYPSPFSRAVILTMDGLGEWATTSVSLGENNSLVPVQEIRYPHSLGLFYSAMTAFCGFKVNSGEYKLMGLAPYGSPRWSELILDQLIELRKDGSFRLNLDYFDFSSTKKMHSDKLSDLFKTPPRIPESHISPIYMDIAASTQDVLNKAILNITNSLADQYSIKNLCLAGGVTLNCVSNSQIVKSGRFENIWIQPAAGDAGGALGAALAAHSLHFQKDRFLPAMGDAMSYGYLGTNYESRQIKEALKSFDLVFTELDDESLLIKTAKRLSAGLSVGWFQGRMEFGPRALGARSILADPRPTTVQKNLNLQIKFRESFRPFAPIILKERLKDWFSGLVEESPYMLFVDYLKDQANNPSPIPAVTHLDRSARLQTLSESQNPRLYQLLKKFEATTGVPVLVNTSFNVRGEPIVESPHDAISCFLKTKLDLLVIGNFFVEKKDNLDQTQLINEIFD